MNSHRKRWNNMIQRIQTLHLIAAVLLGILAVVLNLIQQPQDAIAQTFSGNLQALGYVYVALIAVGAVLAGWSIFLYKTRILQLKMVGVSALLFVAACVVFAIAYFVNKECSSLSSIAIYLPLLCILFCIWARKRIRFDENLVRSADRLR